MPCILTILSGSAISFQFALARVTGTDAVYVALVSLALLFRHFCSWLFQSGVHIAV